MSPVEESMRKIAVDEGIRLAEQFFAKHKVMTEEAHVAFHVFAGMLAIAYEQGIALGLRVRP